jgi:predicted flap endonuclease-1-like 5' DNA nuclease
MALSDLLQRIKAALGIGSSQGTRQEQPVHQSGRTQRSSDRSVAQESSVDVTVEREPATESEDAVKGTETAGTASGSDAEAAGESAADTEPETDSGEESEAAETEQSDEDAGESESAAGSDESDEPAGTEESVDVIKGIGPTYADRLGEAGVETVADLAAADLETLAEESGVSEGRLENWIEKAKHR